MLDQAKRVAILVSIFVGILAGSAKCQDAGNGSDLLPESPASQSRLLQVNWLIAGHNIFDTWTSHADSAVDERSVQRLKLRWTFTAAGTVFATPTVEDNAVYVPDFGGFLYRIDASSGKKVWGVSLGRLTGLATSYSRNSPAITATDVVVGDQKSATLLAVGKVTGALHWKTLLDPNPNARITASPTVFRDTIYVGISSTEESLASKVSGFVPSFRGSMVAVDAATGRILWTFKTVPRGYTGGAVWSSSAAIDPARNSIYIDTGNNYSVPPKVSACIGATINLDKRAACLSAEDHIDSVVALDLTSGSLKWAQSFNAPDTWTVSCTVQAPATPCPTYHGSDYDFGAGPNIVVLLRGGRVRQYVGAGEKSGIYWALDPDTGAVIWASQAGPGPGTDGILWGTAADGLRIYLAENNSEHVQTTLLPSRKVVNGGYWAALDASSGRILWETAATGTKPYKPSLGANAYSFVTSANGVMFAGSTNGDMVALRGSDGDILWKFASGGSVVGGAAIVGRRVYWGSGYPSGANNLYKNNNKLYAFELPGF